MKIIPRILPLLALVHGALPAAEFVHAGIAHSQERIDFIKVKLAAKEQPWTEAWEQLKESDYASLQWKPRPRPHVQRGPYNRPDVGAYQPKTGVRQYAYHHLHW